ncbi:MAG: myo-inosose-2 dehydratase [Rhodospirillaceae bacterium]|nr:myo-inosose-2 dehydratase [Rhodospirillaceae bacterium]
MTIRLGVAPIAWTNSDLPEMGGDTTLDTCLAESRAAGFTGTETGVKFPMDPAVLEPILRRHDIKLVSGWFSGRLMDVSLEEEKRRMEDQLATFAALGAPVMVYAETTGTVQADRGTPVSRRPRMPAGDFPAYGRKLTALAEYMAGRGVRMAYHHHMGTVIETEEEIDRLMDNTGPAVGLLVDTGHMTYAGVDVIRCTKRNARRINHIHCKDVRADVLKRAKERDLSFLDAVVEGVFTVPGDGSIDYRPFARAVAEEARYEGWVVVEAEQDPVKAPPFEYAKKGYTYLSRVFRDAGFEIAA